MHTPSGHRCAAASLHTHDLCLCCDMFFFLKNNFFFTALHVLKAVKYYTSFSTQFKEKCLLGYLEGVGHGYGLVLPTTQEQHRGVGGRWVRGRAVGWRLSPAEVSWHVSPLHRLQPLRPASQSSLNRRSCFSSSSGPHTF